MALKKKLSKTEFEALNEALQAEYIQDGENYVLDVEGGDEGSGITQSDVDKVLQAKQHEKELRLKAEKELKELKASGQGQSQEADGLREQLDNLNTRLSARDNSLKKTALDAAAAEITKHSKFPKAFKPNVLARLQADINESGEAVVTVLDAAGKPSKLTLDALTDEFKKDKEFEGLMLGSQASGGDGGRQGTDGSDKPIKDMNESERVAAAKADPDGFRAKMAAENQPV